MAKVKKCVCGRKGNALLVYKFQRGFFLLPVILLTSIVTLFLMISWRTVVHYQEMITMRERYCELNSAAESFGMWAVALARQHFDYFMDYKKEPFMCSIAHWPPQEHTSNMKGDIKIHALDDNLNLQASLTKENTCVSLKYKLAKVLDESGNEQLHVHYIS